MSKYSIKSMYKQALVSYKNHFWVYLIICVAVWGTINMATTVSGGNVLEGKSIARLVDNYPYDSTKYIIFIFVDYIIKPLLVFLPLFCVVTTLVKGARVTSKAVFTTIKTNAVKMIAVMIMCYGVVEVAGLIMGFALDKMPYINSVVLLLQDTYFLLDYILPYIIRMFLTLIMAEIIYSQSSVKTGLKNTFTFIGKNAKTITILILNALIIMMLFSSLKDMVLYCIKVCTTTDLLTSIIYLALSFTYTGLHYLEWLVFPILAHMYINTMFASRCEIYNQ